MLLPQSIEIISLVIENRITNAFVDLKWLFATALVGSMIMIGAIKVEAAHAFTVQSSSHDEQMVREREVRHAEAEFGDGFRSHTWSGTGE